MIVQVAESPCGETLPRHAEAAGADQWDQRARVCGLTWKTFSLTLNSAQMGPDSKQRALRRNYS